MVIYIACHNANIPRLYGIRWLPTPIGEYLFYFGIIGISLVIIIALHFVLKKKEQLRQKAAEETYTTYAAEQQSAERTTTCHDSLADSGDNNKKA